MTKRIASLLAAAALLQACGFETQGLQPPPAAQERENRFADLGQVQSTISGTVYDPEAFVLSYFLWPADQLGEPPFPLAQAGNPHFLRAAVPGMTVKLEGVDTFSTPTNAEGTFQLDGVPTSAEQQYEYKLVAPSDPITIGGGEAFPDPPFFQFPPANYISVRELKTVRPLATGCRAQTLPATSDLGALGAVAKAMTANGTDTTVADLQDPAKTGGVILFWAMMPNDALAFLPVPAFETTLTADKGTVYFIAWSPPGEDPQLAPLQTDMGWFAIQDNFGPMGYWAVVLKPDETGPVTLTATDATVSPDEGRPYQFAPFTVEMQPGTIAIRRHFALPPEEGGGGQGPAPDPSPQNGGEFVCPGDY